MICFFAALGNTGSGGPLSREVVADTALAEIIPTALSPEHLDRLQKLLGGDEKVLKAFVEGVKGVSDEHIRNYLDGAEGWQPSMGICPRDKLLELIRKYPDWFRNTENWTTLFARWIGDLQSSPTDVLARLEEWLGLDRDHDGDGLGKMRDYGIDFNEEEVFDFFNIEYYNWALAVHSGFQAKDGNTMLHSLVEGIREHVGDLSKCVFVSMGAGKALADVALYQFFKLKVATFYKTMFQHKLIIRI